MSTLFDISQHLHIKHGFCYPDWDSIEAIIHESFPETERQTAWEGTTRAWVEQIRTNLGGGYRVYETPHFLMVSEAPERVIKHACKSFEEARKNILSILDGAAKDEGYGKQVVFMFTEMDDYYAYISHFYSEGEHPMSGGVCLGDDGYIHFAFPTNDDTRYLTVLVHELTHGCLAHLPIPVWLNEALAMRMEQVICGSDIFHLDKEIYNKHKRLWNVETIQQFWTGKSWDIPGDDFELSYNLAQILWHKIEVDLNASKEEITQFITTAQATDAGQSACRLLFNLSLGDLITDFLGEGLWEPNPEQWPNEMNNKIDTTSTE